MAGQRQGIDNHSHVWRNGGHIRDRWLGLFSVYVCVCNGVTERDIRQAAAGGCGGMTELTMRTGCGATCGSCVPMACELLDAAQREAAVQAKCNVVPFHQVQNAA